MTLLYYILHICAVKDLVRHWMEILEKKLYGSTMADTTY